MAQPPDSDQQHLNAGIVLFHFAKNEVYSPRCEWQVFANSLRPAAARMALPLETAARSAGQALAPYLKYDQSSEHDDHPERLGERNDLAKDQPAEDRRRQRLKMHDHRGAKRTDAHCRNKYKHNRGSGGEAEGDETSPSQTGVRHGPCLFRA